jgi:PAS domain-containing protein
VATQTFASKHLPELGRLLKERRLSLDMQFKDVGHAIGWTYSERTLRRIEAGEFVPARSKLLLLAIEALQLDRVEMVAALCGLAGYAEPTDDETVHYRLKIDDQTTTPLANQTTTPLDVQLSMNEAVLGRLEHSRIAVYATTDKQGNVTIWNPAAEREFGWAKGEVIGQPLPLVEGESLSFDSRGIEFSQRRRDGSMTCFQVFTEKLLNYDNSLAGMFFAAAEVTPFIRATPAKIHVLEMNQMRDSFSRFRLLSAKQLQIARQYRRSRPVNRRPSASARY